MLPWLKSSALLSSAAPRWWGAAPRAAPRVEILSAAQQRCTHTTGQQAAGVHDSLKSSALLSSAAPARATSWGTAMAGLKSSALHSSAAPL